MKKRLKVRDVSLLTGVPEHVLRFYEKYGIIEPERGVGNYRYYSHEDLYRIISARSYRGLGFSLRQCKELIDEMNHPQQMEMLSRRYSDISREIYRLNCMQENLLRRMSDYETAYRLQEECELCILQESYWLYSHNASRCVDHTRLNAELMARVMDPLPFINMEARMPVDALTRCDPLPVDWGVSFERRDSILLAPEDVQMLIYTPAREYVVHTYIACEEEDESNCITQEAFSRQLEYAKENGLRPEGTAIIRMLPGEWNGQRYETRMKLCYLPVVRQYEPDGSDGR